MSPSPSLSSPNDGEREQIDKRQRTQAIGPRLAVATDAPISGPNREPHSAAGLEGACQGATPGSDPVFGQLPAEEQKPRRGQQWHGGGLILPGGVVV